jgi:arylsulfatase A-like enzyme
VDQGLNVGLVDCCHATDQATAALLSDLKERGLLEDTLIVWGGEFGRTPMQENRGGQEMKYIGRDHHPEAFSIWLAGGGIKAGISHGATDDLGYDIVRDPVEVRDLHATMLYLLGFDHRTLSYAYQGLDQKLTGVKPARIVSEILS